MTNKKVILILIFAILAAVINVSSAANVETNDKLSSQLHEGDRVSFSINIKIEEGEKKLTIETNLVPIDNQPLYDFGKTNQVITENRYNQKITLNLTGVTATLPVNISGQVPEGETRIQPQNTNIIITKFIDTELKYYEVRADQKLAGIETFELIINKKEAFENTLNSIRRPELDSLKGTSRKLFNEGLVTEAQELATQLTVIKFPGSLSLFGILQIDNETMLDVILVIVLIFAFIIGYTVGANKEEEE